MDAVKRGLDAVLGWFCILLFAALVIVVSWQVFTRQVLAAPSTWSAVAAQYLFVWLSLFGAAYVFGERGHIAITFIINRFGRRGRRGVDMLAEVCTLALAVLVFIWGGLRAVGITWEQNVSGLPFTVGQVLIALPVAGALVAFYASYHLLQIVRGEELAPEPESAEGANVRGLVELDDEPTAPVPPRTPVPPRKPNRAREV
ncbi:MAG: TRAP transporter small permease [Propionibacteriaceae bacterium]|nr:TRAP transporter small permease [Propionibacteriaceae bacterium]